MDIEWILIPEREFLMGLSEQQAQELAQHMSWLSGPSWETLLARKTPQRIVHVPKFYIARFPVTYGQLGFRQTQYNIPELNQVEDTSQHPVICDWHAALKHCSKLGARLPSSIEWEKAARGIDGRIYPWGNEWDINRGNFGQPQRRGRTYGTKTIAVGSYPEGASPYGLEDLMGNCYEWTMTHGLIHNSYDYAHGGISYSQFILIRGSDPDRDMVYPMAQRVTQITVGGVMDGSFPFYTGFRPVMDEWQRRYWFGT